MPTQQSRRVFQREETQKSLARHLSTISFRKKIRIMFDIRIKVRLSVGWVRTMSRGMYYLSPHKHISSNVFVISFCGACAYMEEFVSESRGVEPSRNKSYMVQETNYTRRPS